MEIESIDISSLITFSSRVYDFKDDGGLGDAQIETVSCINTDKDLDFIFKYA
jgi:hypothetical protein